MSIGLCRIRYISLRGVTGMPSAPHLDRVVLTEWCSLCGNDRYYWPALRTAVSRSRGNRLTSLDGLLGFPNFPGKPRAPSGKLQAASIELSTALLITLKLEFDLYRMILYIDHCQLHDICCWFSLYSCNVSVSRV